MPISMTQDNETYYLHFDQVGTLRAVTDENQNIIKEITYDTFGNILQDTNREFKVPFGFAGGLHDRDTNLVHFGYREYDPLTGKWTAKDPIDFSGGDSNLYGYVLGDSVNFIDPWGLSGFDNRSGGHGRNRNGDYSGGLFGGVCGAEGSWLARWVILDFTPEACQKHDNCYSDCSKTKEECDIQLYLENSIYGQAVWNFGHDAYNKAQEHCECTK